MMTRNWISGSPAVLLLLLTLLPGCQDPLEVVDVADVRISAETQRLELGEAIPLKIVATDHQGREVERVRVEWTSDNPGVASVVSGIVWPHAPGRAVVTAHVGSASASIELFVEVPVHALAFEPDRVFLGTGIDLPILRPFVHAQDAVVRAPVILVAANGEGHPVPRGWVEFTSRDSTVVRVSEDGELHGVRQGTTFVTARAGASVAELQVRVAAPYTLRVLGTLGGTSSQAFGINSSGDIVGWSQLPLAPGAEVEANRAFLWENGVMSALAPSGTRARAIADDGYITGDAGGPVLWRDGTAIPVFAKERTTATAHGIASGGVVVGAWREATCTRNCTAGGFIYRDGVSTELEFEAHDVSESGVVVGEVGAVAVRYANGQRTLLSDIPAPSAALGVNRTGQIVGHANQGGLRRAFLWDSGRSEMLGVLRGFHVSQANRINDSGQIVGFSADGLIFFTGNRRRAVLWEAGFIGDLNLLVDTGGLILEEAFDINGAGQIVGSARVPDTGAGRAFLLSPATP